MSTPILFDWDRALAEFVASTTGEGFSSEGSLKNFDDIVGLACIQSYVPSIITYFRPILPEILARSVESIDEQTYSTIVRGLSLYIVSYPSVGSLIDYLLLGFQDYAFERSPATLDQFLDGLLRIVSYKRSRFVRYVPVDRLFTLLSSDDIQRRGYAVLILAQYCQVSEATTEKWLKKYLDIHADRFSMIHLDNAKRFSEVAAASQRPDAVEQVEWSYEQPLSKFTANIGGRLVIRYNWLPPRDSQIYMSQTMASNLRNLVEGLEQEKPLLLKGPSGSGKTTLVEYINDQMNPSTDLVRIHLGDQTDAKALLGTYTTGPQAGQFEWRAGILTNAVTSGLPVLFEDLEKAPTDILTVLLPLLEKRELLIPSRNQTIRASPSFQIYGTISTDDGTHSRVTGERLWHSADIAEPTSDDLVKMISSRYPRLSKLSSQFVDTFLSLRTAYADRKTQSRPVSTRDLFKWASRSSALIERLEVEVSGEADVLPSSVYDDIFREAVSCLAGFLAESKTIALAAQLIGQCMDIGPSKIGPLVSRHVPDIVVQSGLAVIGRAALQRRSVPQVEVRKYEEKLQMFALTTLNLRLLEQIAMGTSQREPMLLVGETGTGKTTMVQYMANLANRKLYVVNISQQIESGDLIGGFKPLEAHTLINMLQEDFQELFDASFSRAKNHQFTQALEKSLRKSLWTNVIKLWKEAHRLVEASTSLSNETGDSESDSLSQSGGVPAKKKRRVAGNKMQDWVEFMLKVARAEDMLDNLKKQALFDFMEGLLVKAVRKGHWILLDEINLAPPDTLESITDLLTSPPSLTLVEQGGDVVKAHSEFRLFACMNPATDVGKQDLPKAVRSRFSELYVESPDRSIEDLRQIIEKYIGSYRTTDRHIVNDVAELYLEAKRLSEDNMLVDGAGQRPHFSIRTLTRTLQYAGSIARTYGLRRALFEGFAMSFSTLLDKESSARLDEVTRSHILSRLGNAASVLATLPPRPDDGHEYVQFGHYWLRKGNFEVYEDPKYIITPFVETNLLNLVRATATKKFPVLIQGPTSSGKTSMIQYLARRTGHGFVRINNHEHTDLQEYVGSYVNAPDGNLVFQEGVLVDALRNGHWIVLDELNLAPTDVLEALNRLLDDNRELLIPETQEVVKPHPDFMLFATQNPPGMYAGRKLLSRAFRNRFLELHFDDIPEDELEVILRDRSQIAPTYAKKIVEVYKHLAQQRQSSRVFEQKHGFATLRDLFRWANREAVGYEQLALNGYMLLAERVRNENEKQVVKEAIERVMRVKVEPDYASQAPLEVMALATEVVWTNAMKRLLVLVQAAVKQNEPVLLVGETGSGKTTIVQVLSHILGIPIHIVNAHQNMETGDIIGSQRPARTRNDTSDKSEPQEVDKAVARQDLLFEWVDGSLVAALKKGELFLLDEISLADDSVLERLNSVLEPERRLLLPEKGGQDIEITAQTGFQFFATMNPGGDYGKKELSPALRNRFTEIWVPSMDSFDDVQLIVQSRLQDRYGPYVRAIVEFSHWFATKYGMGDASSGIISLRNVLKWIEFANASDDPSVERTLFNGACMVFIDSIGSNSTSHLAQSDDLLDASRSETVDAMIGFLGSSQSKELKSLYYSQPKITIGHGVVSVGDFSLISAAKSSPSSSFTLMAPTTALNAMRVVRALSIGKPILLEGSPGVGKTSLVTALAALTGNNLTRINFSDQTDLIDLFGSDVPVEGEAVGKFSWRDAPFLRAMQVGDWVLLDEMNLASQAVLEGLNSCLDHRAEVYIPELDRVFKCHPNFKVFAAQNPQSQGGGRKGLPKSFINRFSVVYVDVLNLPDLKMIAMNLFPDYPVAKVAFVVEFIQRLHQEVAVKRSFGAVGSPFEFNLRDALRWLELCDIYNDEPEEFFDIAVRSRFRSPQDRIAATELFEAMLSSPNQTQRHVQVHISPDRVVAGHSILERNAGSAPLIDPLIGHLQCNNILLETAMTCVRMNWPLILVGPSGSGKTQFLRHLGFTHGKVLHEIAMNAEMDSGDILGEFDQVEEGQQLSRIWNLVHELLRQHATSLDSDFLNLWTAADNSDLDSVAALLASDTTPLAKRIQKMIEDHQSFNYSRPSFRWFDGLLIQAIGNGDWVVLDNANMCSPSVLDRLNSLLEPGGSLLVNECSEADGSPRTLRPHPEFRIFLTCNPEFGELSRAMRNRGVEAYLGPLEERATVADRQILDRANADALVAYLPSTASRVHNLASYQNSAVLGVDPEILPRFWLSAAFLYTESRSLIPSEPLFGPDELALYEYLRDLPPKLFGDREFPLPLDGSTFENFKAISSVVELERAVKAALTQAQADAEVAKRTDWISPLALSVRQSSRQGVQMYDLAGFLDAITRVTDANLGAVDFSRLVIDFVALVTSSAFDESKLAVYREMFADYAKLDRFDRLAQSIKLLGKPVNFGNRGYLMYDLWDEHAQGGFRSAANRASFDRLSSLSGEFDSITSQFFADQVDEIFSVRDAVARALHQAHVTDVGTDVLLVLEKGIKQLKEKLESGKNPRVSHFEQGFQSLLSLLQVEFYSSPDVTLRNELVRLSYFTPSIINTESVSKLYAQSIDTVGVPDIEVSRLDLASELLLAGRKLGGIPSSQYSSASFELRHLISATLRNFRALSSKKVDQLLGITKRIQGLLDSLQLPNTAGIIETFVTLFNAYVPMTVYDPAIRQHVYYDRFKSAQKTLDEDVRYWDAVQSAFHGDERTEISEILAHSRDSLQAEPVPSVYRPLKSQIATIFRDLQAASDLVLRHAEASATPESLALWNANIEQVISRLDRYTGYRDLVYLARTAIKGVSIGQNVALCPSSLGFLSMLNPLNLANPKKFSELAAASGKVVSKNDRDLIRLQLLRCALITAESEVVLEEARELYQQFFLEWSAERAMDAEKAKEESTIFRHAGLNVEEEAEKDFRRIFPDFEEEVDMSVHTSADVQHQLMEVYMRMFGSESGSSPSTVSEAAISGFKALSQLSVVSNASQSQLYLVLPSLLMGLAAELGSAGLSQHFNFYTEPSLEEAEKAIEIAKRVSLRVSGFLERWPEHDTLLTLKSATLDVLEISLSSPLAKFLSKTEQIHHYLNEWQKYASKEATVIDFMGEVTALIVSWRKIELATWPSLFKHEELAVKQADSKFWFMLWENLINNPLRLGYESIDATEIVRTLVLFISGATIGQFFHRVAMLRAFVAHLKKLLQNPGISLVLNAVMNTIAFFEQFAGDIHEQVSAKEKALSKEIKEVILLASWRDVNVLALKQSAQRSHRALYKVVRKYRDFMAQKVSTLIEAGSQQQVKTPERAVIGPLVDVNHETAVALSVVSADSSSRQLWQTQAALVRDSDKTSAIIIEYVEGLRSIEIASLKDLALDVVQRSQNLRDETPKEFTKDTKKVISNLRTEKQRLLTSVLHALRDAGLKGNLRKDIMDSQSSLTDVLARAPVTQSNLKVPLGDEYFYRIIEMLPRLRASVAYPNGDVPVGDLARGMAFGEHLVHVLLKSRKLAVRVTEHQSRLQNTVQDAARLANFLRSGDSICDLGPDADSQKSSILAVSSRMLEFALDFASSMEAFGVKQELEALEMAREELARLQAHTGVITEQWVSRFEKFQQAISSLPAGADSELLNDWVDDVSSVSFERQPASHNLKRLNEVAASFANLVLVGVQEVVKISREPENEEAWFSEAVPRLRRLVAASNVRQVTTKLAELVSVARTFSGKWTGIAAAYMTLLLPFAQGYEQMFAVLAGHHSNFLVDNSGAAHALLCLLQKLATDGFCAPQPPQEEEQDTSKMQDGTGLGDGDGAQSNSKNEEQDEDLEEDALTANKDQKDREDQSGDDEDDAVDFDGDMAGELEDASGSDDDERSDSDELDDEVGDIDDMDPGAIDEKMWDDNRDTDLKEKETDDKVTGDQNDIEAMEDGDQDNSKDEVESQDKNENMDNAEDDENQDNADDNDAEEGGDQDDEVAQRDTEELEPDVNQTDALDLPEDMDLDHEKDQDQSDADLDLPEDGLDEPEPETGPDDIAESADAVDLDADDAMEDPEPHSAEPDSDEKVEDSDNADPEPELDANAEPEPEPEREFDTQQENHSSADQVNDANTANDGSHQPDDQTDSVELEQSNISEQQSADAAQGLNQETAQEQDAADLGESAAASMSIQDVPQDREKQRQEIKETLKELGDAMKEFTNRERDILEASEHNEEAPEDRRNVKPDEVEHIGVEDNWEMQALGKADADHHQEIDQSMGVDESEPENEDVKMEDPSEAAGESKADGGGPAGADDPDVDTSLDLAEPVIRQPNAARDQMDLEFSDDELLHRTNKPTEDVEVVDIQQARKLWQSFDSRTHDLTLILTEQLRLILEPTIATKLKGDYKTGKRLNMKRIIPYIASQYKKDKIWLRRTKPSKRQYQIMLAIDDSRSMGEPMVSDLAFQAVALVSKALSQVEAGQLAIARFGNTTKIVHPFEKPFNSEAGARALQWFGFDQPRTDVHELLTTSLDYFDTARFSGGPSEKWQLEIIVSDGILEDQDALLRLVREAHDRHVMLVFVVLDALNKDGSILEMSQVNYVQDDQGQTKLKVEKYMDKFPFEYYVVVRNIRDLPLVLASVLRQYFQAAQ